MDIESRVKETRKKEEETCFNSFISCLLVSILLFICIYLVALLVVLIIIFNSEEERDIQLLNITHY